MVASSAARIRQPVRWVCLRFELETGTFFTARFRRRRIPHAEVSMVSLTQLWMPILLSAVVVFIASSVIHMVLGYHKSDFSRVPNESAAQDVLRPLSVPPGDYMMAYASGAAEMKDPAFLERVNRGPNIV